MKYIFVTGGVVSSLGKGLAAASLGTLLEHRGIRVVLQKFDPYLNVDPGTMSPYQHGEVYVLDDGAETDLDLGHYERFTSCPALPASTTSPAGKSTRPCIRKRAPGRLPRQDRPSHSTRHRRHQEPHLTRWPKEMGGGCHHHGNRRNGRRHRGPSLSRGHATVRATTWGADNVLFIHVTLVPFIKAAGELKTKPTQQQSVARSCREIGIAPGILICRSEHELEDPNCEDKIAMFCNIESIGRGRIPRCRATPSTSARSTLHGQKLDRPGLRQAGLGNPASPTCRSGAAFVDRVIFPTHRYQAWAVVGKYIELQDAYKSDLRGPRPTPGPPHDCRRGRS